MQKKSYVANMIGMQCYGIYIEKIIMSSNPNHLFIKTFYFYHNYLRKHK